MNGSRRSRDQQYHVRNIIARGESLRGRLLLLLILWLLILNKFFFFSYFSLLSIRRWNGTFHGRRGNAVIWTDWASSASPRVSKTQGAVFIIPSVCSGGKKWKWEQMAFSGLCSCFLFFCSRCARVLGICIGILGLNAGQGFLLYLVLS